MEVRSGLEHKLFYYKNSWIWLTGSWIACALTILASKTLRMFNYFTVINSDILYSVLEDKTRTRPIITISNHRSLCDSFVLAALLRWRYMLDLLLLVPWTPSAKDICHRSRRASLYFRLIKSLPMERGGGVFQPVMDTMIESLNNKNWIHIFPEGRINKYKERLPYKTGIGRLITESDRQPIIIPFYLSGTSDLLPMKRPYYPRIGQRVTIVFGQPVKFTEEITTAIDSHTATKETWMKIAEELHTCMDNLQEQAEKEHGT